MFDTTLTMFVINLFGISVCLVPVVLLIHYI